MHLFSNRFSIHPLLVLVTFLSPALAPADSLRIFVIRPRIAIDWKSPASLTVSSARNSIGRRDYAPIGHFAVEIACSHANRFGVREVRTAMERKDIPASQRIVLREGLGLGSLTYSFVGALQSAPAVSEEVASAEGDRRLDTIEIPTSPERCDRMLEFLESWIEAGSYTVYGGGKNTALGEGAGCADFAMEFFRIATETEPDPSWHASVRVPATLVKSGTKKIGTLALLGRRTWAVTGEAGMDFRIPDADRVQAAIRKAPFVADTEWEKAPARALKPFRFQYATEFSPETLWDSVRL